MIWYLLLTAFTVSIDSFLCGFSFSCIKQKRWLTVFIITLTVYAMCFIANYLAIYLSGYLTEKTASFSGTILIVIGIITLIKKDGKKERETSKKNGVFILFVSGLAVGVDGAFANLSLSLMGINAFYVPLIIAVIHGIMIFLGTMLGKTGFAVKLSKYKFFAPLLLIGLGIYKVLGFFI